MPNVLVNDDSLKAIGNAIKTAEAEMGAVTGGLNLPGLF